MNLLAFRSAVAADIPVLCEFLFDHGVNDWNHLPEGPIRAHLGGIAVGNAHAVLVERENRLLGFVSFELSNDMANYQPPDRRTALHGVIHEAVVGRDCQGQGLGTQLLSAAVNRLTELGCREVYVARHDENPGSAGMMRKAGFEIIDVYDDFARRSSGNRRTAISRRLIDSPS
ncbi:MAG: GNAT family N-acetyltransferase [Planctomycetaceae bacterium]